MKKKIIGILLSTSLLSFLLLSSCGEKGIASVSCVDVERLESNFGEIATSSWTLGEIKWTLYQVNDCILQDIGANLAPDTVAVYSQSISAGDEVSLSIESDLNISLTGNFKNPTEVEAEVKSSLEKKSELMAYNFDRIRLNNPIARYNYDSYIVSTIKNIYENTEEDKRDDLRFVGINRILVGDSIQFYLDRDNTTAASIEIRTQGDAEVTVNYNCNSRLGIKGEDFTLLMYQYIFLEWDPDSETVISSTRSVDVNRCEHISLN